MKTDLYNELPELISANEAQTAYKLSRSMVYELLNRNDTGVVKIGRRKFFHRDTFRKWLEEQAVKRT